jgi:uncharacterized coiled-coil DUF342 family protein
MAGLNYTSVATVALHVNNLIKRGHLRKRDHSARSIEVLLPNGDIKLKTNQINPAEEKWLVDKIEFLFTQAELGNSQDELNQLVVLVEALKILGMDGAAQSFIPRLSSLKQKATLNRLSADPHSLF